MVLARKESHNQQHQRRRIDIASAPRACETKSLRAWEEENSNDEAMQDGVFFRLRLNLFSFFLRYRIGGGPRKHTRTHTKRYTGS